eukprot:462899_1
MLYELLILLQMSFIYSLIILLQQLTVIIPLSEGIYANWMLSNAFLPRSDYSMATAYDYSKHRVWFLGGYSNSNQLISYEHDSFIDHGISNLSTSLHSNCQFYTTVDDKLWIMDSSGSYLNVFDILDAVFIENIIPFSTFPLTVCSSTYYVPPEDICLTSFIDNNIDNTYQYIIVTGGWYTVPTGKCRGSTPRIGIVRILNITSHKWNNHNAPNMLQWRSGHSCIVHQKILYVIGGIGNINSNVWTRTYLSSIEVLNIAQLQYVATQTWNFIDSLRKPLSGHRSVVYDNNIIIIGGYNDINGYNNEINVINTITHTVSSVGYLQYAVSEMSVVVIYPYIYAFAGSDRVDGSATINMFQYTIVPTYVPTNTPSNSPSNSPTNSPTNAPSNSPSNSPTNSPTNAPSNSPSNSPINSPTNAPSNSPSNSPTNAPSNSPSNSPRYEPTFESTFEPTNIPTLGPTDYQTITSTILSPIDVESLDTDYANRYN